MEEHADLLNRRVREGRIVDGHGDVRCESICVVDGIRLFDCIEFNDRFRCGDVAGEVAFLAMDLDALGRPDLGYWFAERYRQHSMDGDLFRLLPFYRCYRAYVRAKVQSFRIDEPEFTDAERQQAAQKAEMFFDLARRYATPLPRPAVVVVAGLSGTGKTTLARAVAAELGVEVVSTDAVRADLFGQQKRPVPFGEGVYGTEASRATYSEVVERSRRHIDEYGCVLLDGTFLDPLQREGARALAESVGAEFRLIRCQLSDDAVHDRLERRRQLGDGVSDACWETYLRQRELRHPSDGDTAEGMLVLDTSRNLAECSRSACDWLRGTRP